MAEHIQILLKNIREKDYHRLEVYEKFGGYASVRKALEMDPLQIIEEVKTSGLRGRGGAGFPTGLKWSFVPRDSGKPVYLINNADESEPGTFKDRVLLERNPHLVIEGMLCAAWALQSNMSIIYIRGEYAYPYTVISAAIKECYQKGYLGENIFGSGFTHHMLVHRGAGAYICGEETALLESLEGKKGQPRLKPPFPAVEGLYGCPTVINNVETLSTIPWIVANGGAEYAKIGVDKSSGTKLVSASGHIKKPGVYEIEMGYPLLEFIENECGGIREGHSLKAVIPGGSSVNILTAEECKGVNLDYESCREHGTSLGCAGFMVLDDSVDMVEAVLNLAHFYAHESCGQCTPCREGGHWIEKVFARIARGEGLPGDMELIESVCAQIGGHTICAFGDTMVLPYLSILKKFAPEFRERIDAALKGLEVKRKMLNMEFDGAH
ncbi:MAG: NADH oxidoreductase (quinone) subunit F [Candidatus Dadabacteria bacterium]|nr:MAG: NADH oxidoreductase (quinone) subunit F [Candidatus Dadabacteria bacterium]